MRARFLFSMTCGLLATMLALPASATAIVDWSGPAYYVKTAYWDAKTSTSYDALEAGPFSSQSDCDSWLNSNYGEVDRLIRSCEYFATSPYKN